MQVAAHGWLALVARGSASDLATFRLWLEAPVRDRSQALTHHQALARALAATAEFLAVTGGPDGHPKAMQFELNLVADGCRTGIGIVHTASEMVSMLRLPLLRRIGQFKLGSRMTERDMLLDLAAIISHEAAHAVQLMPFDADRLGRLGLGRERLLATGAGPQSMTLEVGARLVEHCVTQASMPTPRDLLLPESLWLDARDMLMANVDKVPELRILDLTFATIHRVLGAEMRAVEGGPPLVKLMGLCAMALQRPTAAVDGRSLPTPSEARLGEQALERVRALGEPIRFRDDDPQPGLR